MSRGRNQEHMFTGRFTQDSRNAGGSPEERRREGDVGRWLTGSVANIRHDISSLRQWTKRMLALEFGGKVNMEVTSLC